MPKSPENAPGTSAQAPVRLHIDGALAHVELARGDKMNAITLAMAEALIAAASRIAENPAVRAVVLSGEGRAFCAGLDMSSIAALRDGGADVADAFLAPGTDDIANKVQQMVLCWRRLPVPVVAAVHGVAYGGGFQLMLGADMRYAAPHTDFSVMEIRWGLIPDMAGIPLMSELVRADILRDLVYSGRRFPAEDAERYGLITRVTPDPLGAAHETAQQIAQQSPDAIRAAKRLLTAGISDLEQKLQAEAREQRALIGSPNQREAVAANLAKRAADFR